MVKRNRTLLTVTRLIGALVAASLAAVTSEGKAPGPAPPQGLQADNIALGLASLGIDPVPFLGAVASLRRADCAAGSALSFTSESGALGTVLAVAGLETISEPFRFVVVLDSASVLDPAQILGSSGQLEIAVNGVGTAVSGVVTEARVSATTPGHGLLVMTLEPAAALQARGSGFSVHQNLSAPDLVNALLRQSGVQSELRLTTAYSTLDFRVRYGESVLAFISHLMEEEGIHYHFEDNTMVFGDANAAFPSSGATLVYAGDGGRGTLTRFGRGLALVPTLATVRGFNFLLPNTRIESSTSSGGNGVAEIYAFASAVTDQQTAQRRAIRYLEGASVEGNRSIAASSVPAPRAGRVVTVVDNVGGAGGPYLVTAARHLAVRGPQGACFTYGNEFSAIPSAIPFRPPRVTPVPKVGGAVSAIVTGPPGSTVYHDVQGRVKIQFHFDREGKRDENSSAWVRVAVPPGHIGEIFVPRIGSEVLVTFIDGDPSQPVVSGALINTNDPPLFPPRR